MIAKVNVYDDDKLKYDYDLHQYVINPDAIQKYLGIDIYSVYATQQVANAELVNQSMQVYNWLYDQIPPGTQRNVEYLIATGGVFREAIFKALIGQAEYALASRGNEVPLQHGISFSKGTAIPLEVLRGNVQVSLKTEQALRKAGLLYNGVYRWRVPTSVYRKGY
jgi:hypothetical protein